MNWIIFRSKKLTRGNGKIMFTFILPSKVLDNKFSTNAFKYEFFLFI